MKTAPISRWYERIAWGWVTLAAFGTGFASLLIYLIVWLIDDGPEEGWLLVLPASPVLAWIVAYRVAREDWPDQPSRTIAATVTGCGVAAATLLWAAVTD